MVQIPGQALRISHEALRREMAREEPLRRLVAKYSRFAFGQLAQIAACNRLHTLEERCCRWLLTAQDAALDDSFPLTHEFFAMMLGVNRARVSTAAHALRMAGMIDYRRGRVTIIDRRSLENSACECHGSMQSELDRSFGTPS